MSARFRRLSAPGASALACWELSADAAELRRIFGESVQATPRLVRAGARGQVFDEGLLWMNPDARAELHLHGGGGTAHALRAWLTSEGWEEDQPQQAPTAASAWPTRDEAWWQFLHASAPLEARVWQHFAEQGGAEAFLREGAAWPAAQRALWARAQLREEQWAEALEQPAHLVLAGPPNAGKSSLFNAWLRAQRSTVTDAAGTTRDSVGERLRLGHGADAWTLQLVDTAGLWQDAVGVDAAAVLRTEAALESAWRVLWVFDAAQAPDSRATLALSRARAGDLRLLHRCDRGESWSPENELGGSWLRGSVLTDPEGLLTSLEIALNRSLGPPPEPGACLPLGRGLRAQLREWAEKGSGR